MGFFSTYKFINRHVRRRVQRRFAAAPLQWNMHRTQLDQLVRYGRIETTLPKAKELQQYAEELVFWAKQDTARADGIVESMLVTSAARSILYESLVPRYAARPFFVSRVVNQFRFRLKDAAPMAFLEFVDRSETNKDKTWMGPKVARLYSSF
eukprot:GHVT01002804.1.p1 GENE.GHVT01002804.1~~GHVT01002804.1.p1  ORF type:complete len:152 (-),score=17.89 GHVT01002804.1:1426-1881(-)